MSCSYDDCNFECYESHDECIFHCDKGEWLTPARKQWKGKKVEEFWNEIRQQKNRINNQFIGFIFPEFEDYSCQFDFRNNIHITTDHICIANTNFGLSGSNYKSNYNNYLNQSSSFLNATFLDIADFSKIHFEGSISFENTTFEKDFLVSIKNISSLNFDSAIFKHTINLKGYLINNCSFKNTIFYQKVCFSEAQFNILDFSEAQFHDKAVFNDVTISSSADFSESTFADEFSFSGVSVTGETDFSSSTFAKEANFENGSFGANADFSEAQFKADAKFAEREFLGDASFPKVIIKGKTRFDVNNISGKADFSESTFSDEFSFSGVSVTGETDFSSSTFAKEANFENGSFGANADFSEAQFKANAKFTEREFLGDAKFLGVKAYGFLDFSEVNFSGLVTFTRGYFEDNLLFKSCSFDDSCHFGVVNAKGINFTGSEFHQPSANCFVSLYKSNCGSVDFSGVTISDESFFSITEGNSLKELILNDIRIDEDCEFELRETTIGYLSLNRYTNKSEKVLFDSVTVTDKLTIKHVSFDKERFNHFDISKPDIEIERSAFNNDFFNSVKWGTISENRYKATRDIFRQLKFFSEQQKNYIDADGFYSLEMKEQKKELYKENKELKTFSDKISHYFSNTFVFQLHEKTSNFSQSWLLPVFWLIIVGMFGVLFHNHDKLVISSLMIKGFLIYSVSVVTLTITWRYVEQKSLPSFLFKLLLVAPLVFLYLKVSSDPLDDIAKLLNPINIFKNTVVSKPNEFISLIYKIIILFLVYQVIASIKKKVRSK